MVLVGRVLNVSASLKPSEAAVQRCSKNMQQICRRIPMPKCDFNKVSLSSQSLAYKVVT